jgi:hypothetical protein
MISFDQALDGVMQLPPDQQETLINIVRHRRIEQRRDELAQDAQKSIEEFRAGQYQPMTIEQVLTDLRSSLEEASEICHSSMNRC